MLGTYALSSGYYDAYYSKASRVRTLIRKDFDEAYKKIDCIICPASPTPAFRLGEKTNDPLQMYLSDIFTISANLSGIPALSLPCGFSTDGLPIGMQLLAAPFKEDVLLRVEHGKPLVFGKNRDKGIVIRNARPEIVEFAAGNVPEEVAVYDETNSDMAYLVSGFTQPEFPVPLGVLKATAKPSYEELYYDQIKAVGDTRSHELETLLTGPDAWDIK